MKHGANIKIILMITSK